MKTKIRNDNNNTNPHNTENLITYFRGRDQNTY